MSKAKVNLELDLICNTCGKELKVISQVHKTIFIQPCSNCQTTSYHKGLNEGRSEAK